MKKVLITGKDSYIGTSVENWLLKEPENFQVTTLDMRDPNWKVHDFSKYDTVFHVAGIAHSDTGKADEETKKMYYKINTNLTIEVARHAKESGVKQFIFMSSMIVYGESAPIGQKKVITRGTVPTPANFYGDSKLQADLGIQPLNSSEFKVASVRPPMIYGKGSKGNYPRLAKLAKLSPIFPNIDNERSMLHIDNLCEFIKVLIEEQDGGYFYPQNREHVRTSELVREIAKFYKKNIILIEIFNPILHICSKRISLINKVFGNLTYDQSLSEYKRKYRVREFCSSITETEK